MAWIGLHTGPNVNPHATLAWWRDENPRPAVALHICKRLVKALEPQQVWVSRYERFGVRNDIDVAMLEDRAFLDYAVSECAVLHESDWPIRPHVTHHQDRQTFKLAWLGLHLPEEERYWRL
jgi:hypothetical protein